MEDIAPIQKALFRQTDDALADAAEFVTDQMVDEFSIAGSPDQCIERIAQYEKRGINLLILALPTDHRFKPWEALRLAKEKILPYFRE